MTSGARHPADLTLAGFSLWIHKFEFPESRHITDREWLDVTAEYRAAGASVRVQGSILQRRDIQIFLKDLGIMYEELAGKAVLGSHEPNLKVTLACNPQGLVEMTTSITPDHLAQQHEFVAELDQSYLPPVMTSCREILSRFPDPRKRSAK